MKKKKVLAILLMAAILVTSMVPFCVFAESTAPLYSISGYLTVSTYIPIGMTSDLGFGQNIPDQVAKSFMQGIKVEINGTDLSAVTDKNGYFVINNIPAKDTGYVLKFSRAYLQSRGYTISSFTQDTVVSTQDSAIMMNLVADVNGDGAVNMTDVLYYSKLANSIVSTCKISGYVAVDTDKPEIYIPELYPSDYWSTAELITGMFKQGIKVEIDGTDLSAITDKNGYFEINNIPSKNTGYTLKLSREYLNSKEVTVQSLTQDVAVSSQSAPVMMKGNLDVNGDGTINMSDIMYIASHVNNVVGNTCKISGDIYVDPHWGEYNLDNMSGFEIPSKITAILGYGINVQVDGTTLSAVTDQNGHFEINNVPASSKGYVLKLGSQYLINKEYVIQSLSQDLVIQQPITMRVIDDLNGDGCVDMSDTLIIGRLGNGYYSISGYIAPDFQYSTDAESNMKKDFKIEVKGTNISAVTDANGYFEFLFVPEGCTLKISKPYYLYKEVKIDPMLMAPEISTSDKPFVMSIGDFNGDDVINIIDIMTLAAAFNSRPGDQRYNTNLDLNRDGAINITDILIVAKSFNKKAPLV